MEIAFHGFGILLLYSMLIFRQKAVLVWFDLLFEKMGGFYAMKGFYILIGNLSISFGDDVNWTVMAVNRVFHEAGNSYAQLFAF